MPTYISEGLKRQRQPSRPPKKLPGQNLTNGKAIAATSDSVQGGKSPSDKPRILEFREGFPPPQGWGMTNPQTGPQQGAAPPRQPKPSDVHPKVKPTGSGKPGKSEYPGGIQTSALTLQGATSSRPAGAKTKRPLKPKP